VRLEATRSLRNWRPNLHGSPNWSAGKYCSIWVLRKARLTERDSWQIYLEKWSSSNTTSHGPWLGGYAGFTVASFLACGLAMATYTQLTAPHASLKIHSQQLNSVLAAPIAYFRNTPSGRLINRWSGDMNLIDFAFPRALQDFTFTAVYVGK
jgi:ABC-type multidrug transport system fused ATPase/permease subunit